MFYSVKPFSVLHATGRDHDKSQAGPLCFKQASAHGYVGYSGGH